MQRPWLNTTLRSFACVCVPVSECSSVCQAGITYAPSPSINSTMFRKTHNKDDVSTWMEAVQVITDVATPSHTHTHGEHTHTCMHSQATHTHTWIVFRHAIHSSFIHTISLTGNPFHTHTYSHIYTQSHMYYTYKHSLTLTLTCTFLHFRLQSHIETNIHTYSFTSTRLSQNTRTDTSESKSKQTTHVVP